MTTATRIPPGSTPPDAPPEHRGTFGPANRLRALLDPLWRDRRLGVGAAVAAVALWGLAAGWWTPRGPLTTAEALWAMAISLAVGAFAGLVLRSRWAILAAPVVFVAVFELVRLGTDGPMVDGLHASPYGFIAFVVGRGFHGLVTLLPMLLGAAVGAGCARRLSAGTTVARSRGSRAGVYARRSVTVLTAVGLIALAVLIARPASTDPILGADGEPLTGSISELTRVDVGSQDLGLMIRGNSTDNPVLLSWRADPAAPNSAPCTGTWKPSSRTSSSPPGTSGAPAGHTELDPASTLSLDGAISDTIEVTNYLRQRFNQDQIYVVGQSWGTILCVLAVQRQPDLYRAFVGTGQMVSPAETDQIIYTDTLAWARDTGDDGLVETLTSSGPPYDNISLRTCPVLRAGGLPLRPQPELRRPRADE